LSLGCGLGLRTRKWGKEGFLLYSKALDQTELNIRQALY